MPRLPRFQFGICGIDSSVSTSVLQTLFGCDHADRELGFSLVVAFLLAYQGYPWDPAEAYAQGAPAEKRRYGGLSYPAWYEIEALQQSLPRTTAYSFHLNETPKCPYVSDLLKGAPDILRLVDMLVDQYKAQHIQINLHAGGVDRELYMPQLGQQAAVDRGVEIVHQLCSKHPNTIFIIPLANKRDKQGVETDTSQFIELLFRRQPVRANLCAFFDNSGGTGSEPDAVPNMPQYYPQNTGQFIGFTGGIGADNAKKWLSLYAERARKHGCSLLCDAQSSFRRERSRGAPIDESELCQLVTMVRDWASEQFATEGSKSQQVWCPTWKSLGVHTSGPLSLDSLQVKAIDGEREYPQSCMKGAARLWEQPIQLSPGLVEKPVWTVVSHSFDRAASELVINMQLSSSKYVLYAHLRTSFSEENKQFPMADRADIAGLMALTETADGFFVCGRRPQKVPMMPGWWQCAPSGRVDSLDFKKILEQRLQEEVGASWNDIKKAELLALMDVGQQQVHNYEFVFRFVLTSNASQVLEFLKAPADNNGNASLVFVRAPGCTASAPSGVTVVELEEFVRGHELTDVSRRALLLAREKYCWDSFCSSLQ